MRSVPAVKFALILAFGILLGDYLNITGGWILLFAAGIFAVIGFWNLNRPLGNWVAYFALLLSGMVLGGQTWRSLEIVNGLPEGNILVGGKIISEAYRTDERAVYIFRPDWTTPDGRDFRPFSGKLRLIVSPKRKDLILGSRMILFGGLESYPEKRNPGGRNLRQEFTRQDVVGWIKPISIKISQSARQALPARARQDIAKMLRDSLPTRQADLLTGMILGDRNALPENVKDDFRRSGLYHLLAVSGLHVGYLFGVLTFLVSPIVSNLRLRRIILFLGLWGYVVLTGASPPTVRAAVMLSLVLISFEIRRVPQLWNLWGAAALIILLIQPRQLFQPGFQLSFAAMAGVLVALDVRGRWELRRPVYPMKSRRIRSFVENYIWMPLLVSFCAVLFTAPILTLHFGGFAPIAIILNVLAIPLAGAVFGLTWVLLLFKMIAGVSIAALNAGVELGLRGLESLAFAGARLPGSVTGDYGGLFTAGVMLLIGTGILLSAGWKQRVLWLGAGLIIFVLMPFLQSSSHLRIECFDVGQGDATLLRFPGENNLLVDCGSEEVAQYELVPSLRRRGINHLQDLLITHFDRDHAGGAVEIIESLRVDRLLINSLHPREEFAQNVLEAADRKNIPIKTLALGDTIAGYPRAKCLVLWPPEASTGSDNRESIVLRVSFGESDILLTGDISSREERFLRAGGDLLDLEVLKVAHHGSRYSSDPRFLQKVRPRYALISSGLGNSYGHPAARVLTDLETLGCTIHRTDLEQAAVWESDGENIWEVSWR